MRQSHNTSADYDSVLLAWINRSWLQITYAPDFTFMGLLCTVCNFEADLLLRSNDTSVLLAMLLSWHGMCSLVPFHTYLVPSFLQPRIYPKQ
jgi:hypothetical protein